MGSVGNRLGYRPALDGIRACAVLAVLAYHAGTPLTGGFVGVDVFFVLSGFLITTLLFEELDRSGSISLRKFYGRRARRLLPALFLTVAGVGVIYTLAPSLNRGLSFPATAAGVIFYVGNWIEAFATHSTTVFGLLDHTWSLAIEEQFYILWPPLLFFCLRRRWQRRHLAAVLIGLAVTSATLRALLWSNHVSSNIYFRTDTRADGLLIGCALAAALSTAHGKRMLIRAVRPPLIPIVAGTALILIAFRYNPADDFFFYGGLTAVAVCSALIIGHVISVERSWPTQALSLGPLVWIGARSYGIYLFHIPIFGVIGSTRLAHDSARIVLPLQFALTAIVAAMSYRWIESYFLLRRRHRSTPPHVQSPVV